MRGLGLVGSVGAASAALACAVGCKGIGRPGQKQPESIFEVFAPPTPAVAAAWASDPYDADKRYRGMLLLANAPFGGERVYVEMYAQALGDADPAVRGAAVRGLALHGSPGHVPLILPLFEDPDWLLRWECARALQRLHNPAAVPSLLKRLQESVEREATVRAAAADALGQYAEPRVLDGLIAALGDRDLAVNEAALRSLRTLTGQDFGDNLRAWIAWKKGTADLFAARRPYIYPVFNRPKNFVEMILPVFRPPNEVAASPAGLAVSAAASGTESDQSTQEAGVPGRNN